MKVRDRVPVLRHDIVFAGFLQNKGTQNGMVRIFRGVESITESLPDHLVWFQSWNSDVSALAEFITRYAPENGEVDIRTYSYSYGVMSNMNFAYELKKRSSVARINHIVCSDGVYRHAYKLGWWRSAFDWTGIKVPANVDHVTPFRQKNPRWKLSRFFDGSISPFQPAGHTIVAEHPEITRVDEPVILSAQHAWMDDSIDFRNKCYEVASK